MLLGKIYKKLKLSTKLCVVTFLLFIILASILYMLMPILLNYPPETVNTPFDKDVSKAYYYQQYSIAMIIIVLSFLTYLKLKLKSVDKWLKNRVYDIEVIKKLRLQVMRLPLKVYLYLQIIPTVLVFLVLYFTGSHLSILLFKVCTITFTFSTLLAGFFIVFAKRILYPFLKATSEYVNNERQSYYVSLKYKIMLQIIPGVFMIALFITFLGYHRITLEKVSILNTYYKSELNEFISKNDGKKINIAKMKKDLVPAYSDAFCFIEYEDGRIETSTGVQLTTFFIKYMHELSPAHNNTVYEVYGIDAQAVIEKVNVDGQECTAGIYYEVNSISSFFALFTFSILLFSITSVIIYFVIKEIIRDITEVTEGLELIIKEEDNVMKLSKLPITTNDEIGDLIFVFNKLQVIHNNHIEQIQDSQDKLMEKERLASLGQLVAGIAHNLKTPIMSIAGASEGLIDLIKEYDSSIGDPEVNEKDHHDIAKDMEDWVDKIKIHSEYMSDIITTVKGQVVALTSDEAINFTISELVKRVDILMKHELKYALIKMNVLMKIDSETIIYGNINSLVQVLNNIISNAIHAYDGEPNKEIDLEFSEDKSNIIISLKDYGKGIPNDVREKIFKEMITTKGKKGTGLGLYMSYSNIRAHFNGIMKIESKVGKGTTMTIILPKRK